MATWWLYLHFTAQYHIPTAHLHCLSGEGMCATFSGAHPENGRNTSFRPNNDHKPVHEPMKCGPTTLSTPCAPITWPTTNSHSAPVLARLQPLCVLCWQNGGVPGAYTSYKQQNKQRIQWQ